MNNSYEKFDVFIVGGNLTGLICAIALSQNKIKVGCCDPNTVSYTHLTLPTMS